MRAKLPPATGTAQWVGEAPNGLRLLEIVVTLDSGDKLAETYEVAPTPTGYKLHNLTKAIEKGEFVCYTLTRFHGYVHSCNCPDATNRIERKYTCKHVRGLVAAIKSDPF